LAPEAPPKLLSVESTELVLFGLLVAVAGLAVLAGIVRIPYPILLVLGGLGIGLVPGAPEVELDPDIVLLVFLPPLLSNFEERTNTFRRFRTEVIGAERDVLRRLRDEGRITDEVRRKIEYDLDLEEARIST